MPTYSVSKTWNASETLTAADLNGIESQVATFLNTTKLDGDNISATATYTFGGVVLGSGGPAAPDGGNLHSFNGDASASAHADADEGVFENSAAVGISLLGGATSSGNIFVGDSGDNDIGKLSYSNATNAWTIYSNATLALTLSSAQLATFAGAIQADSTLTVGQNDTGHDVKFFGATAGKSWLWDESADTEILTGNSTISGTLGVTGVGTFTAQSVHTGGLVSGSNIVSDADSTDDLGTTSARWANLYVDSIGDTGQALAFTSGANNTTMTAAILALTGAQTVSSTLGVTGLVTATAGISSGSNIVSDTDSTDDLGTTGVRWANLYVDAIVATDTIAATSYTGALLTAVTAVTQSDDNNSTKVATTAYVDSMVGGVAAFNVGATHTWTADQTFNDSVKVTLGTGGDADLYYDGTNVVLLPRVVGTGNVGINTTAPLEMLDVTGTTTADQARIVINDAYNSSSSEAGIDFYRTYDTGGANQLAGYIRHTRGGGDVNGGMVFGYGTRGAIADKMTIDSAGNVKVWDGTGVADADKIVHFAPDGGHTICQPGAFVAASGTLNQRHIHASASVSHQSATHATYTGALEAQIITRAASSAHTFLLAYSSAGSDAEFRLRGDGEAYADGSWNASGADYQEYFQSSDDTEIETGLTVVLDGDKVRAYDALTDTTEEIIGVKRPQADNKNSAVIGNTAWNHWADKYLTDDWGVYLRQDVEVTEWEEREDDDVTPIVRYGEVSTVSYNTADIPDDVEVPEWATTTTVSERKLNPAYAGPLDKVDPNYVPREDRDEWNLIGLLGQIQIKAGEATNPRWKKMKDISVDVELWYVR